MKVYFCYCDRASRKDDTIQSSEYIANRRASRTAKKTDEYSSRTANVYDDNRRRWNSTATRACANSRYQALSLLLNRPGYEANTLCTSTQVHTLYIIVIEQLQSLGKSETLALHNNTVSWLYNSLNIPNFALLYQGGVERRRTLYTTQT